MTNAEVRDVVSSLDMTDLAGAVAYAYEQRTTVLDSVGTPSVPAWFTNAQSVMCFDGQDFAYLP
jgi:hypothetical protein